MGVRLLSIESKHHLLTLVKRESICFSLQQAEVNATAHVTQSEYYLRECLCKSGPVDFAGDTDLAHFLCVVRHSCTYTKTTIRLIGSLYFSEFYGN